MFSQKNITIILIVFIVLFSYQTVALAAMAKKLEKANIGMGSAPAAVSFTDDGSAPQMVGGC